MIPALPKKGDLVAHGHRTAFLLSEPWTFVDRFGYVILEFIAWDLQLDCINRWSSRLKLFRIVE